MAKLDERQLCSCGCSEYPRKQGSRFCRGHNLKAHGAGWQKGWSKGLTKETDLRVRRIAESKRGRKRGPPWNKGLTKETDSRIKQYAETKSRSFRPSEEQKARLAEINRGKKHSRCTRRRMRLAAIRNVNRQRTDGEPLKPRIGKEEHECLHYLQKYSVYLILRQFPVAGYFLDGYIKELNFAIEFDERWHESKQQQKEKDLLREVEIVNEIGCFFFRVNEIEWQNSRTEVIDRFRVVMQWKTKKSSDLRIA